MRKCLIIVALLATVLFWAVLEFQRTEYSEFDKREKQLKASLDSLTVLQHKTDLEAIKALTALQVAKNQLREQSRVTEKYKFRYEAIKKTRAPMLSDRAVDSLVSVLYPIR